MKAMLLKSERRASKYGGHFFYLFFKGEDGKSYRSCVTPACRNFAQWKLFLGRENVWVEGLMVKSKNMIDADSVPKLCREGGA